MSNNKRHFDGTAALVTGASRGLGRAIALRLAERGAAVALVARGGEALAEVAAAIEAAGGRAVPIAADLSDRDDIERIAAVVGDRLGALDLLVHNASVLGPTPLPLLLDLDPDALADVLITNVVGMVALSRRLVGPMVLRGRGQVVAISSDAAVEAYPGWGAYGASKAAQDHLMRTYAAELADQGLQFVVVDPGEMDTVMHHAAVPDADRSALRDPDEVARALLDRIAADPRSDRLVLPLPAPPEAEMAAGGRR